MLYYRHYTQISQLLNKCAIDENELLREESKLVQLQKIQNSI